MPLDDGQLSYNGLVIGEGTMWGVVSIDKLLDPPELKEIIDEKAGGHGSWRRANYFKERHVVITGYAHSTPGAIGDDLVATLNDAFAPREDSIPLAFNVAGLGEMHYLCKPGPIDYQVNWLMLMRGFVPYRVELVADDPTMYVGDGES